MRVLARIANDEIRATNDGTGCQPGAYYFGGWALPRRLSTMRVATVKRTSQSVGRP